MFTVYGNGGAGLDACRFSFYPMTYYAPAVRAVWPLQAGFVDRGRQSDKLSGMSEGIEIGVVGYSILHT